MATNGQSRSLRALCARLACADSSRIPCACPMVAVG
jgi:hypothetical protein